MRRCMSSPASIRPAATAVQQIHLCDFVAARKASCRRGSMPDVELAVDSGFCLGVGAGFGVQRRRLHLNRRGLHVGVGVGIGIGIGLRPIAHAEHCVEISFQLGRSDVFESRSGNNPSGSRCAVSCNQTYSPNSMRCQSHDRVPLRSPARSAPKVTAASASGTWSGKGERTSAYTVASTDRVSDT